jgi:hypothetical protein
VSAWARNIIKIEKENGGEAKNRTGKQTAKKNRGGK